MIAKMISLSSIIVKVPVSVVLISTSPSIFYGSSRVSMAPVVRHNYKLSQHIQNHVLLVEETGETMAGPKQEAAVQLNMMQLKAAMHLAAASLSAASSPRSDFI